jgi:serine/threonine protein kinase
MFSTEEEDPDDRNSLFGEQVERTARGSFVGSPLFVSPEMLEDNISSPSNDLWALGVIIY